MTSLLKVTVCSRNPPLTCKTEIQAEQKHCCHLATISHDAPPLKVGYHTESVGANMSSALKLSGTVLWWPQSTISLLRTTFSLLRTTFSLLRTTFSLLRTTFSLLRTTFFSSPHPPALFAMLRRERNGGRLGGVWSQLP